MADLYVNPALTLLTSLVVAMVAIVLVILCIKRRKSVEVSHDSDPDTAFDEYRRQQQASSLEDLRTGAPPTSVNLNERNSSVVLTSTEELEEHDRQVSQFSGRPVDISRISRLPGASEIDQFPDEQHVYRLDPTEGIPRNESLEQEQANGRTVRAEDERPGGTRPSPQVEYAKVDKKPKATTGNGSTHRKKSVEYAKVNKKANKKGTGQGVIEITNDSKQVEYDNRNKRTMQEVAGTANIVIEEAPDSLYEKEQYIPLWKTSTEADGGTSTKGRQTGTLEIPGHHHATPSFPVPNRHISTKSTASNQSDFLDCTQFRKPEPRK